MACSWFISCWMSSWVTLYLRPRDFNCFNVFLWRSGGTNRAAKSPTWGLSKNWTPLSSRWIDLTSLQNITKAVGHQTRASIAVNKIKGQGVTGNYGSFKYLTFECLWPPWPVSTCCICECVGVASHLKHPQCPLHRHLMRWLLQALNISLLWLQAPWQNSISCFDVGIFESLLEICWTSLKSKWLRFHSAPYYKVLQLL